MDEWLIRPSRVQARGASRDARSSHGRVGGSGALTSSMCKRFAWSRSFVVEETTIKTLKQVSLMVHLAFALGYGSLSWWQHTVLFVYRPLAFDRLLFSTLPTTKAHWVQDISRQRDSYYVRLRGQCL